MSRPVFLHVLILKPGGFFGGVVFFFVWGFFCHLQRKCDLERSLSDFLKVFQKFFFVQWLLFTHFSPVPGSHPITEDVRVDNRRRSRPKNYL